MGAVIGLVVACLVTLGLFTLAVVKLDDWTHRDRK